MSVLTEWYGRPRLGEFPAQEDGEEQISTTDPKINPAEAKLEYKTYKNLIFKLKLKFNSENRRLQEVNTLAETREGLTTLTRRFVIPTRENLPLVIYLKRFPDQRLKWLCPTFQNSYFWHVCLLWAML